MKTLERSYQGIPDMPKPRECSPPKAGAVCSFLPLGRRLSQRPPTPETTGDAEGPLRGGFACDRCSFP